MTETMVTQSRKDRKNKQLSIYRKALFGRVKTVLYIAAWAFIFYSLQPFITAAAWWKAHQIMMENAFSLSAVNTIFTVIEYIVCFGMAVLFAMLSWSEWNYWRISRPVESRLFMKLLK
ncbi:poly-beta-1,6-N-acetyl-D-glucosamine biosynthesis protein PgaD [Pelosinus propionicus]|uniref:Uncharacterized protein n=1 Tax=Pelosinus propionicus DSM 13327 TaxID=1123291 RepID=A0A1I4II85_9FIRM|nr:poly-beta-1,6-N-acetyl-D-glucosamine biosynthesis protein PgaD [Pelosinus propionicus]SFL54040.1 hypothetical protein SAMN04490355_100869 [Pelosinus propionicus DSM 13327]